MPYFNDQSSRGGYQRNTDGYRGHDDAGESHSLLVDRKRRLLLRLTLKPCTLPNNLLESISISMRAFLLRLREPTFLLTKEETPPEGDVETLYTTQQSSGINFDQYESIPVEIEGTNIPPHMETFQEMKLHSVLTRNIARCGYTKPTPVQKYSFPVCTNNRDLMSCAQTGSGKTAGFLMPILDDILKSDTPAHPPSAGQTVNPVTLIVSPTRELASQIYDECRKYSSNSIVKTCVVYGGRDIHKQLRALRRGCHIIVGTPGRLIDVLNRGYVSVQQLKYFVLDEADCMLDMGFEPQIREIVDNFGMPKVEDRQTLMFSATFPKEIQRLARDFLRKDYVFLTVGRVGAAAESVNQTFIEVPGYNKLQELMRLLREQKDPQNDKILVFVKRKVDCETIVGDLKAGGFRCASIHGNKSQQQREKTLAKFKRGQINIMVATDVAARGLDIRGIEHVVNYDMPDNMDSYVHRIGRTGRVGHTGQASTFFNNSNGGIAKDLVKECEKNGVECPDFIREIARNNYGGKKSWGRGRGGGRGGRGFGGGSRYGGGNRGYGGGNSYGGGNRGFSGGSSGGSRFNPY
eukprot:CAMPEP_0117445240 /NCGR_PEP_ID=MMETSP0759-20121206/5686_1 /TAXON_ID=63605 /ORGANISM="Percolomonas cosmopolitus, Strain WS" /LENGTH=575 /DNA_ID=CAMNT_0005237395 /DNA_START=82 /DNA_END=1809 /DNA_ORIENTATION=-